MNKSLEETKTYEEYVLQQLKECQNELINLRNKNHDLVTLFDILKEVANEIRIVRYSKEWDAIFINEEDFVLIAPDSCHGIRKLLDFIKNKGEK